MSYVDYMLADASRTTVMVFPIGNFKTAKYPKLDLSKRMADAIVENFKNKVLGATEPFIDSSGRHDEGAPAAAWVKNLFVAPWEHGEALYADIEWTPVGQDLVRNKLYRYLSPVIAPHVIPETGEKVYPVLRSLTLTNIPVLRMMPEVQASEQAELMEIACSELVKVEEVMSKPDETVLDEQDTVTESITEEAESGASDEAPVDEVTEEAANDEVTAESTDEAQPESEAEPDEDIVGQMMQVLAKLDAKMRYKRGAPALRAMMKEVISKARYATSENDEDISGTLEMLYEILAESEESGKEMNSMQKLVDYFKLAEDADEDAILEAFEAKVTEMSEALAAAETAKAEVDATLAETMGKLTALQTELAEQEKAARDAALAQTIEKALADNLILPADIGDEEHPGWLKKLSETNVELFEQYIESRKTPAVDTRELAEGEASEEEITEDTRPADVRLAEKAKEYVASHEDVNYGEALNLVLAEDEQLAKDYNDLRRERLRLPRN